MSFRKKEIILLLAAAIFFSGSIAVLTGRWFLYGTYYSQGPLVAAAFFWLLYRRYRIFNSPLNPSYFTGSIIVFFAMFIDISGRYLEIETFRYFAVYFFITGGAVFFLGRSFVSRNFILFIYLLLAIPLPGFVLDAATFDMKLFSARISEMILSAIYPSTERFGSMLYINGYYIEITPACSGMENIFGMFSLLWFFALIQKKRIIAWLDYALSLPAAVFSNIARIVTVSILTVNGYGRFALEDFHDGIGVVIFLVILFMFALFNELSFSFPEKKHSPGDEYPLHRERKGRDLLPYTIVMTLLAAVSLGFQLTGYNSSETKYPLKKDIIARGTPGWSSADEPLEESYYTMLRTGDILMRQYIRKGSTGEDGKVYLYFVHAMNDRGPFLHRPELCLTGEGYNLVEQNEILINGIPAYRMLFSRNGRGLLVYYWYKSGNSWIGSYMELQKEFITGMKQGGSCAMFRLSRIVDLSNVEKGERVLRDFALKEIPVLLKNL